MRQLFRPCDCRRTLRTASEALLLLMLVFLGSAGLSLLQRLIVFAAVLGVIALLKGVDDWARLLEAAGIHRHEHAPRLAVGVFAVTAAWAVMQWMVLPRLLP